jgi:hypothetical protein
MKLLSVGSNIKMAKKIGLFNLPAKLTCPGKTQECERICYAQKAERCYPSAKAKRQENFEESGSPLFVDRMVREITDLKLTQVRIHESGDFYNQGYLDKWIAIAKAHPSVSFLAFTKSFHLDFTQAPNNLVIIYSLDQTTDMTKVPVDGRHTAQTLPKGVTQAASRHVCAPVGKDPITLAKADHYHYCGDTCRYCWSNAGDVAWIKH